MNKYRLWDKLEKRMIYADEAVKMKSQVVGIGLHGLPIAVDQDSFKNGRVIAWNVDHRYNPMQCIGNKDKNGNEIYEGDIIVADWHWTEPHAIVWPDDYHAFIEYGLDSSVNVQVIGNVQENPDLLNSEVAQP